MATLDYNKYDVIGIVNRMGASQNALGKHVPQGVGKQRQNVNPHRLPFPSKASPAFGSSPDRWKE